MILQGRNLSKGISGNDVRLFHCELQLLGYSIPADELGQGVVSTFTLEVIGAF